MTPITLAVLDDHALITEAIAALLTNIEEIEFIAGFETNEALDVFLEDNKMPDILLLDIQLKSEDGLKICQKLTRQHPDLKIIMLSSITQPSIVLDAFKKGAKGFLPKNITKQDLVDACTTVCNDKTYLHKDISLLPDNATNSQYHYIPKLTRREKEILKLIMQEMTTTEISKTLNITISTIETHRSSLLSKTGSKNVVGLIKFTLEKGLLDDKFL